MKRFKLLGHRLPYFISNYLYGNRTKHGKAVDKEDIDWVKWQDFYKTFYIGTQKTGIGSIVNDAGYKIMSFVDLAGKIILEIGPGKISHQKYWKGSPYFYTVLDIDETFVKYSVSVLANMKIPSNGNVIEGAKFPVEDLSVDIVVCFYSLEHFHPIDDYLSEIKRVLKVGGKLIGAIPTEGSLAWGLGRTMTSRRFVKKNADFDFSKILCWEHPNFADDILNKLTNCLEPCKIKGWPFGFWMEIDLVCSFIFEKKGE